MDYLGYNSLAIVSLLTVGYVFFRKIRQSLRWLWGGPKLIHDLYAKYPDTIYQLPNQDRVTIVLPPRYLKEIKELPEDIGNNSRSTSDFFVGWWTTLDLKMFSHHNIEAIKTQYIAKIGQQVDPAHDEALYGFHKHFTSYQDWTPVVVQPKILQIVAQMVARTVVGPEICRNPEWVQSVTQYAQNVFQAATYLKLVPPILRPLVAAFTPYIYRIHRCRRTIKRIITPTLDHLLAWRHDQPESWAKRLKSDTNLSTVDWLVAKSSQAESQPWLLAHRLTGVSFGASHTTSNHIGNCILELAADFERWALPLREEIEAILGRSPSTVTNADLSKMWKLDSFMKECQRFHPPSKLSVNRTLLRPYTLSSGQVLPKDAHICFAGVPMSLSEEYFENAETFDGFRFERMRRDPKMEHFSGLQFTSSYAGSLHFGHGKQMCPGRFMGSLIAKLFVIEMLQRYDLKLVSGEKRPPNIMLMDMDMPDPKYKILMRDRAV
ncbi:putative cytochrome P450 [Hypoxylon fuscum]|nr:putative cytochrome P450 [Hypoxylon fuscum]